MEVWLNIIVGVAYLQGRRDDGKGSGSRALPDKLPERSRRSVEMRKLASERERDRRKSAPGFMRR